MSQKHVFERFIWFDQELRAGKYPNATGYGEKWSVSPKTALRDIEYMRSWLAAPIEYDASRRGFYYSDETFSLPFTHLTFNELSALLVARQVLKSVAGNKARGELSSAIEKLTAILHKSIQRSDSIDDAVSFQQIEYAPSDEAVFMKVLEACLRCRSIELTYYSPASDRETKRVVEPYHLLNYMGTWHLIAHCRDKNGIRDFVLARIKELKMLDEPFRCKKNFQARCYIESAFGIFKGAESKEVILRFSQKKSRWIKEQIWHRNQKLKTMKDGSVELTVHVADELEIMMEVLRHGADVEVIRPASLRKKIAEEAENILAIYKK